ncbi:MAG: tRNA pseudouridine(38-40) synthase TruA, partial [Smithellaceae bacterium]|nr:tRNA pseudouridine(38-40) synthase TruA [Smithellaceae bacterium]
FLDKTGKSDLHMMRNFKLILEYDGTAYCGWQRQLNGISIQQVLEEAVSQITGEQVSIIASGRTDAGVHAIQQVASFKARSLLPVNKIFLGVNSVLPEDIVVKDLQEAPPDFNALKDAKGKIYVYRIRNQRVRPVLGRQYFWFVRFPLDLSGMQEAALHLIGEHDFSSFCATGCDIKNRIRTLSHITIHQGKQGLLEITVESSGFLRHMVRNIVGTLVDVGRGKLQPKDIPEIITGGDRKKAGVAAPAHGLFLKEVKY